jgi:hypothetical protein
VVSAVSRVTVSALEPPASNMSKSVGSA